MKMRTIFGLALIATLGMAFVSQTAQDYFQQALSKERGEGNLREAIALYQKAIETAKDESLAAKAQLQIGLCYEKLGLTEARKAFQTVIEKYPNQREVATEAKKRINSLETMAASSTGQDNMRLRRIGSGTDDIDGFYGAPTEVESEWLSIDWEKGEVAIKNLLTRQNVSSLVHPELKDPGSAFMDVLCWSKDKKRFAFTWKAPDGIFELRVFERTSRSLRVLVRDSNIRISGIFDWSADGGQLLILASIDNHPSAWFLASLADGRLTPIFPMGKDYAAPHHALFSPDGKYFAFDHGYKDNKDPVRGLFNSDIRVVSLERKTEVATVEHPAFDYLLGWSPNGRTIVFASNRSGKFDAWGLPFEGGSVGSDPMLLKNDIGIIEPFTITPSGALVFWLCKFSTDVYGAELNPPDGSWASPPRKISRSYEGANDTPALSPDGKRIAYLSIRKPQPTMMISPLTWNIPVADTVCVYSFDTGQTMTFTVDLRISRGHRLQWTPDGRAISFYTQAPFAVYRLDSRTGATEKIIDGYYFGISPEGRFGIANRIRSEKKSYLINKDFLTGEETDLIEQESFSAYLEISPDASQVAFMDTKLGQIHILPTAGGPARAFQGLPKPFQLNWTPDGKMLLFGTIKVEKNQPSSSHFELWGIPFPGGTPGRILESREILNWISYHPESRRFAFTNGPEQEYEIWVLENFLPRK